jgi:hypothetical protein
MEHYENVIAVARSFICGNKEKESVKINDKEKPLIAWLNTRKNEAITNRDTTISKLSRRVLLGLSIIWFTATAFFLFFMFCRCYVAC